MLDGVPVNGLSDLTGWGVVGLVVLLIIFGRLVPLGTFRSLERERDHWRATAETLRDTNGVQARTIERQLVVGETVERVMGAVQDRAAPAADDSGGGVRA